MNNENYDLIHADEGVTLHWDDRNKTLTVSGEGRCELGDVRGGLETEGTVEATAQTVGRDAESFEESTLTAEAVGRDAVSFNTSTLTAEKVEGDACSYDESALVVGGERARTIVF
jgi:hypothetical protein